MAVYGLNGTGNVPFTGYTNTLGNGDANVGATAGYVYNNGIGQFDDKLAKILQSSGQSKVVRALWRAMTGAAVGSNATATTKRVVNNPDSLGGVVPIETVTHINRNTTAADRTAFLALLDRVVYPSTYPADLSGNGGGGKVAY